MSSLVNNLILQKQLLDNLFTISQEEQSLIIKNNHEQIPLLTEEKEAILIKLNECIANKNKLVAKIVQEKKITTQTLNITKLEQILPFFHIVGKDVLLGKALLLF